MIRKLEDDYVANISNSIGLLLRRTLDLPVIFSGQLELFFVFFVLIFVSVVLPTAIA